MGFVDDERTAAEKRLGIARGALFGKSGEHGATFAKNAPKMQEFAERRLVKGGHVGKEDAPDVAVDMLMEFVRWFRRAPKAFVAGTTTITGLVWHKTLWALGNWRRQRGLRKEEELAERLLAHTHQATEADDGLLTVQVLELQFRARKRMTPAVAEVASLRWEGKSYQDIAETLGISVETVKSHVSAMKEASREEYAAAGHPLTTKRERRDGKVQERNAPEAR